MRVRAFIHGDAPEKVVRRVVRAAPVPVMHTSVQQVMDAIDRKTSVIVIELSDKEVVAIHESIENRVMKLRKITPEILEEIKGLIDMGVRMKNIETKYGITRQTIYNHLKVKKG